MLTNFTGRIIFKTNLQIPESQLQVWDLYERKIISCRLLQLTCLSKKTANAAAQSCHFLEPQARLCSEQQKVAQMTRDVYRADLAGRIVWVQQRGERLVSGGKSGARRG